ncbi:hypothetical protein CL622_06995, partial [archaeon]|nr:hypothetical protein [archaeon]
GFVAFMFLGVIVTFIFDSSENNISNNSEKSQKKLQDAYSLALSSLNESNFLKANEALGQIIQLDSNFVQIDSIRTAVNLQFETSKSTIDKSLKNLEQKMKFQKDEFQGITWVYSKTGYGTYGNNIYCYFGMKDNQSLDPRMVIRYHGDDWIFWRKATFLIDGERFTYFPASTPKTDNTTKVWESSDDIITESTLLILQQMFTAESVKYRLQGDQFHADKTLSASRVKAIQDVLKYKYILDESSKLNSFVLN